MQIKPALREKSAQYDAYLANGAAEVASVVVGQLPVGALKLDGFSTNGIGPRPALTEAASREAARATALNRQAIALYRERKSAEAISLAKQARDIRKRVLGTEHPDYATSLNNLAAFYQSMDEYVKAEPLYLEARDINKRVLGRHARSINARWGPRIPATRRA